MASLGNLERLSQNEELTTQRLRMHFSDRVLALNGEGPKFTTW